MSFSMSRASLPSYEITLTALSAILDKADAFATARKVDPSVLLQMRLAPDMFPLVRQIQIATDLAKNGMARLAGTEAPRFEDSETSFAQLKDRLARTMAFIKSLDAGKIDASLDRDIRFPVGPTKTAEMKGADYLTSYVTPNVYFHVVAAYSILRHCGVEVGKMDYLGGLPIRFV
jgi:hypothetical protein